MTLPVGFRVAAAYLMSPARTVRLAGPEPALSALRADAFDVRSAPREREAAVLRLANELQDQPWARLDSIRSEDVVAACRWAQLHGHAGRRGEPEFLWSELLRLARIDPYIDGRFPAIPEKSLLPWLELQDAVEPDVALIAYLGYHRPTEEPASFDWARAVPVKSDSLDELFSRGVYDLHVHSGGLRNFTTTWRALRARALRLDQLGAFQRDPAGSSMMSAAFEAADRILGTVTEATSHGTERRSLYEAIRDLRSQPLDGRVADDRTSLDKWIDIERILIGRTLLWRKLRQPMFRGPPGLSHFSQGYFRQSKRRIGMSGKIQRMLRGGEREIGAIRDLADTCVRGLHGIELRMAPLEWPADYARFLDFWEAQAAESALPVGFSVNPREAPVGRRAPAIPQVGVRFAVHLQRSSPADESETDLRAMLDRRTACYFLARGEDPRVAEAFVRIDIAGPETFRSGTLYSPYFGLLLGHPDRLEDLEWLRRNRDRPAVAAEIERLQGTGADEWLAIPQDRLERDLRALPLGASWHAGEDFGDVLAGIYEIATALASGLRAGDAIGHGLALQAEPNGSDRQDRSGGFVSWRIALESYLWLYDFTAERSNDELRRELLQTIKAMLCDVSLDRSEEEARDCVGLVEQVRRLPVCALCTRRDPDDATGRLLRLIYSGELADLPVVDRTSEMEHFCELIEDAQARLVETIGSREMLVELNPSSNWRIFSPRSLEDLPTFKIAAHSQLFGRTIVGTDDPGTFGTSIDLEYALLRRGLEELKKSRKDLDPQAILERSRQAGRSLWEQLTSKSGSPEAA